MREIDKINEAKLAIAGVEGTLEMLGKCDWRTTEEMKITMTRMAKELAEARQSISENLTQMKINLPK